MAMDAATQTTVIRDYVLPALQAKGLKTRILVYDHNWDDRTYSDTALSDATLRNSSQVAGTAWHWYAGTPGTMTTLHNKYPSKDNHVTEASGGTWVTDEVTTDFETITQSMRNWSKSYIKWGLALDQNRGPHAGGCGTCTPLVTVNTTNGSVSYPIDYYTLGHFSRFVISGATRVYSSNATGIISTAFVNPDGTKVLVAFNDTNASNTFQVAWGTQSFSYTLPALSGVTFAWSESQLGSYTVPAQSKIQASSYNDVYGLQTETTTDTNGGYDLGFADNGFYAQYKKIDFGSGVANVDVRAASAGAGGTLEFHLDSATGKLIGSVNIPITGGWQTWTTVTGAVSGASGVHDLYAVFKGTTSIGNLNWFAFRN
jgi:glucosylceramidase